MKENDVFNQEEIGEIIKSTGNMLDISEDRQRWHIGRVFLRLLKDQGFSVFDLREPPEGVEYDDLNEPAKTTISVSDVVPPKIIREIAALFSNNSDPVEDLVSEIVALMKPAEEEILEACRRLKVPEREVSLQRIAEGVIFAKSIKEDQLKNRQGDPPYKVKVYFKDGNRTFTRYGEYVSDVEIYFATFSDGSIESIPNAEQPYLSIDQVNRNAKIAFGGKHPKLVLQNGEVIYGFQIQWEKA